MVFVYNDEAVVEDTVFVGNTVEVSTIILASPKKSKKNDGADATPPSPRAARFRVRLRADACSSKDVLRQLQRGDVKR